MPSSFVYTSGRANVFCATLLLAEGRYCGNFIAIVTRHDGSREIHEHTCARWDPTLQEALTRARAMAEAFYPATPKTISAAAVE
jgi:hypothetical protein